VSQECVHRDNVVTKVIAVTVDLMVYLAHLVRKVIQVHLAVLAYLDHQVLKEETVSRDRKALPACLVMHQVLYGLLCGHPNRPRYGSCSCVRRSVPSGLQT